jgi:hypothetical protein
MAEEQESKKSSRTQNPQNHMMSSLILRQLYLDSRTAEDHNNKFSRRGSFLPMWRHFQLEKGTKCVSFVVHCILGVKTVIAVIMVGYNFPLLPPIPKSLESC